MNFETACEKVKKLRAKPKDETLLQLYGLYKQSTLGDCCTEKPWFYDIEKTAKWEAWSSHAGKSKSHAQDEYITLVQKLLS